MGLPQFIQDILSWLVNFALNTGIKIVIAVVLLIVGFRAIAWLCKKMEDKAGTDHHDKTVTKTLAYLINIVLKVLLVIFLISYLGIDTTGLTALVASLGVCFGLAVNGAVGNIAGGVLIIFTRPFRIDDYIEAQGVSGKVAGIQLTSTKIVTDDNKVVFIPNGALSAGNIVNYSMQNTRRLDFTFSITPDSDFNDAQAVIRAICAQHESVLKDPAPMIRMAKQSAASTDIVARVWVNSEDYWAVHFDILEAVKVMFESKGIQIR